MFNLSRTYIFPRIALPILNRRFSDKKNSTTLSNYPNMTRNYIITGLALLQYNPLLLSSEAVKNFHRAKIINRNNKYKEVINYGYLHSMKINNLSDRHAELKTQPCSTDLLRDIEDAIDLLGKNVNYYIATKL